MNRTYYHVFNTTTGYNENFDNLKEAKKAMRENRATCQVQRDNDITGETKIVRTIRWQESDIK